MNAHVKIQSRTKGRVGRQSVHRDYTAGVKLVATPAAAQEAVQ